MVWTILFCGMYAGFWIALFYALECKFYQAVEREIALSYLRKAREELEGKEAEIVRLTERLTKLEEAGGL